MRSFKYCPDCGAPNACQPDWPFFCPPPCGSKHYPPFYDGVALILWLPDHRVMVIRRGTTPIGGLAFVGGFINPGEAWRYAAARELLEETYIVIEAVLIKLVSVETTPQGQLIVGQAEITWDQYRSFQSTQEATEQVALWPAEAAREGALCFSEHTAAFQACLRSCRHRL